MSSKLFQVSILNNINLLIRVLTGIITAKLIAVYVGPAGMALMGNFRNFLTSLESVSTLGFQNGIVKYVSEYRTDEKKKSQFIAVLVVAIAIFSLLISGLSFVFRQQLSDYIFDEGLSFSFLFVVLACVFPIQAFNIVFISIINGLERYKTLMTINILGNLLGFFISALLVYYWTLNGALLALILAPAFVGLISFLGIRKDLINSLSIQRNSIIFQLLKPLFAYSIMALFTGLVAPLVSFYIRTYLMDHLGIDAAGYWEATNRISNFYMMFINSLIAVYFLPKLSLGNRNVIRKEIKHYFIWILPIFALGLLMLYQFRTAVITLLMSEQFLAVSDILSWQLLGDFFKAVSLIFGILFYAKRIVVAYLITEGLSFLTLVVSSVFLVDRYGIEGATMAHACTYFIYLALLFFYFRKKI